MMFHLLKPFLSAVLSIRSSYSISTAIYSRFFCSLDGVLLEDLRKRTAPIFPADSCAEYYKNQTRNLEHGFNGKTMICAKDDIDGPCTVGATATLIKRKSHLLSSKMFYICRSREIWVVHFKLIMTR